MKTLTACLAFIALAPAVTLAQQQSDHRDAWSIFVQSDHRFGFEHVIVTHLPTGNLRYRVEVRTLVDLLGQKQESKSISTYVVTPNLEPVSVQSQTKQLSGATELSGASNGSVFEMQRTSHGVDRSGNVELSNSPIFLICLPDWLKRQPAGQRRYSVSVINEETLNVEQAECELIDESAQQGRTWRVVAPMGPVMSRGQYVIKDGILMSRKFTAPKLTIVHGTEREARDIRHLRISPRNLLMFPIEKDIQRTDRLTSLSVRLTWRGIPIDQFKLEDNRQKIVTHEQNNGAHTAVVQIQPLVKATDHGDGVSFPIRRPEFKSFLSESQYIKPTDPGIVSTARQWTQDTDTALEAVSVISARVSDLLRGGELIAETLSGPEVLQCRKGKCTEHSTLFASLARSLGIPTRIVLGNRMINGNWVGHMWNEAWVGHWITIDTTTNEVGNAPALLKFVHSNTVRGTQDLRWGLTDSLNISIVDFSVRVPESDRNWMTGIVGGVYTNADFGCRITAPTRDWVMKDVSQRGQVMIRTRIPDKHVQILFGPFTLPGSLTAESVVTSHDKHFRSTYKGYKIIQKNAITRNGREWYCLQFTRKAGKKETAKMPDARRMRVTEYVCQEGKTGFLIKMVVEEQAYADYEAALFEFVDSFRLRSESPVE